MYCRLGCKGNLRSAPPIKPINKHRSYAVCRCITAPKSQADKDGKCHWRIGNKIIDNPQYKNSYMENFYCSKRSAVSETAPKNNHPPYRIPPNMVCKNQLSRIVGGVEAVSHSWPWIMNMAFGGMVCAGTILDDETVVTVAHCCDKFRSRPHYVKGAIGDHNWKLHDEGEQTFRAISVHVHPKYSRRTIENDICVVKFSTLELSRRQTAANACLPPSGYTPPHGTKCWAAGWGIMSSGKPAEVLQEVDLNIISDEVCQKTQSSTYLIKDSMMCAGWLKGGKDGCQGDSGGPLICQDGENQPVLTGITSWGFGCGAPNKPGMWTKVSTYIPWLKSHML